MFLMKNQKTKSKKYIVLRDKKQVSDEKHSSVEEASSEFQFWSRVVKNHDPRSKVEIVEI